MGYNLRPLNFRNTIKFFAYHCPHLHSSRERKELLEELASHTEINKPAEDKLSKQIKSILGGGIPAKTFAVAYEMSLEEFQQLKNIVKEEVKWLVEQVVHMKQLLRKCKFCITQ